VDHKQTEDAMKKFSFPGVILLATISSFFAYTNLTSAITVDVTIAPNGNLVFSPSSVTIHPGDIVRWTWGASFHSTTSGIPGAPDGIWDSGILNQGDTFTHTFNSTGDFPYFCTPHGGCCGMVGMVSVVAAAPSPTPTSTRTPTPSPTLTPIPSPSATATPRATPTLTPSPTPDGCVANFTTAEGCDALGSLTSGSGNTALGWRSLFLNSTGSFNTGVGAGALALNNAASNTAIGAAALLLNTTGTQNTAIGTDALVFNDSGAFNTATGYFALTNNTTGGSNTATGLEALTANTTGSNNTAIGNQALQSSVTNSDNIAVGQMAGSGITSADNNIIIGHNSGVHSVFGQVSDRCTIDNIFGAPVSAATAVIVMIDSDGRLGTFTADGLDRGGFSPKGTRPQAMPDAARQTMLDRTVEDLQATIAQQQQQIETLTAQLKRQAAEIQKVNAQLEMRKPAAKMVVDKP
jgi:plastocyanin